MELFTLRLSHRTLPNSLKLTFCNGTVLHRNQVRSTFGDWLEGITELSKSLQAIDIDASAYACLSALTLVNGTSVRGQGPRQQINMTQLLLLGKFEYTGGPIFKVVLEC